MQSLWKIEQIDHATIFFLPLTSIQHHMQKKKKHALKKKIKHQ